MHLEFREARELEDRHSWPDALHSVRFGFATATGVAMGMSIMMIPKGREKALEVMQHHYPTMVVLALSGNNCVDGKLAVIEGGVKSVIAEAVVPGHVVKNVVKTVLKTRVAAQANLNTKENLVASAMAGSIGGFNTRAANIFTAMFIATGKDPAQDVGSSV